MKTMMETDRNREIETSRREPALCPRTDITEHDDHFSIEVELPGVAADRVDLQIEDDELRLTAPRGQSDASERPSYLVRERRAGTYVRTFHLGAAIDREGVRGEMTDGVLRIRLPKAVGALPRRITIN